MRERRAEVAERRAQLAQRTQEQALLKLAKMKELKDKANARFLELKKPWLSALSAERLFSRASGSWKPNAQGLHHREWQSHLR